MFSDGRAFEQEGPTRIWRPTAVDAAPARDEAHAIRLCEERRTGTLSIPTLTEEEGEAVFAEVVGGAYSMGEAAPDHDPRIGQWCRDYRGVAGLVVAIDRACELTAVAMRDAKGEEAYYLSRDAQPIPLPDSARPELERIHAFVGKVLDSGGDGGGKT